ncbi:MAG TPA: D-alanyl-D-alanine carboxypeptidase, partial [Candidatus Saccharimonadia bacterium]|nr:D-alanyl-D-alanine carboxypeptidase [Candidatus Saccharimonadia bacterium]
MNRKSRWIRWVVAFAVIVVLYLAWAIFRPLPGINATGPRTLSLTTPDTVLAWPAAGQSAVGVTGTNILLAHGVQKPAPTASTAKLITCLLVLKQKPLSVGQQGPTITLTPGDVAIYNSYLAHAGSTVPVAAGEQISEYQMLEAILLPSANNMADSLAIWAYGSLPAYTAAANAWLKQQGLADTTVGSDASGYNPSTVSTAADLVRIGEMAMQSPVLAGVVGQTSAAGIPMAGTIKNVN